MSPTASAAREPGERGGGTGIAPNAKTLTAPSRSFFTPRARQLNFMVISTLEKRVAELEAQVLQNSKAAVKDALEGRVKSLEEHVHKVARKSVDEQVSRIDEKLGEKNKEQQSMLMEKMQTIASKAAEKGVKSVERNLYVKVSDANQEHFERVASLTGGWKKPFVILCGMLAVAALVMRMWYVDLKKKHLL